MEHYRTRCTRSEGDLAWGKEDPSRSPSERRCVTGNFFKATLAEVRLAFATDRTQALDLPKLPLRSSTLQ